LGIEVQKQVVSIIAKLRCI